MGNSEVGHLNLGAGSVVPQDLARIDGAIADGSFFENEALVAACERARARRAGACTCSAWSPTAASTPAGSTSRRASSSPRRRGCPTSSCTRFTDGRDTSPTGGAAYMDEVGALAAQRGPRGDGRRPLLRRWTATSAGSARSSPTTRSSTARPARGSAAEAIAAAYEHGETDEFIQPTVIGDYDGMAGRRRR